MFSYKKKKKKKRTKNNFIDIFIEILKIRKIKQKKKKKDMTSCPPSTCLKFDLSWIGQYLYIYNSNSGSKLSSQVLKINNEDSKLYAAFVSVENKYQISPLASIFFQYTNLYELVLVTSIKTSSLPPVPSSWPNYKLVTQYDKTTNTYSVPFFVFQNVYNESLIDKWGFLKTGTTYGGIDQYYIYPCKIITCEQQQSSSLCQDNPFCWEEDKLNGILKINPFLSNNKNQMFEVYHQPSYTIESFVTAVEPLLRQSRITYNLIKISNQIFGLDQFYYYRGKSHSCKN